MTKTEALSIMECSISELGRKLGISHSAVSQWREEEIPMVREYQIVDITKGKIPLKRKKRHQ